MKDSRARHHLRSADSFTPFDVADCDQAIHCRFEQQAARCPDAVAIRLSTHDVSYAHLNAAANRAARTLLAGPGTAERPVALILRQGYESVVWTLAILKAGLCYAPLDQRLPAAVLRAMVADLGPGALVVDSRHLDLGRTLGANRVPVVDGEAELRGNDRLSANNLDRPVSPDGVAYVFCTSGSTGRPKGVADSHRNVLHNVCRYTNTLRFAPDDRLSLVQNPSFSGTVSSLFGALLNGASVAPFDLQGDGLSALSDAMRRARVTVFHAVPSIFRELSDPSGRFPDIRLVRLEGDRVTARDIRHFQSNFHDHCTLVNGLGATECGLVRQFFVDKQTTADAAEPVPIGYPVPDVMVKIVDDEGRQLPPDSPGEIAVESRFLATGYWRNPELTARRFEPVGEGVRRYRTGDLGRLREDGCLVHLGRVDHRIRIAGEFIDTEDIERLLQAVPGITQAVVHDFVDQTLERRLCAYVVRDAASTITAESLREALSARVARHAMPTTFMFLDALPLSNDSKVDRSRLPKPGGRRPELPNDYVAPVTALEQRMAQVWSEVLDIQPVGVTDSLFDLGGDSLRAARIVSALHPTCGERIRMTSLFEHPTIRALARALEHDQPVASPAAAATGAWPAHSIAVIGMAGRFPGAETIDQFWSNLRLARESITFFRPDEIDGEEPGAGEPGRVLARGWLTDVDRFDAPLFRLTPLQAQMLDPQQRVWLECVYRAMEDAGLPMSVSETQPDANIGVFVGGRESSYLWHLIGGNRRGVDALLSGSTDDAIELLNSNDRDSLATRTSFLFGFTGPSINVQTACSTSLVAIVQACQALVSRQCEVAIAGGVAVTFPQKRGHRHQAGGIYSRDGHCRPFDADASGTVFSDGAGAVVLKRLEQARADGDRIDAVIRGWAVNNDGSIKASFAAPNVDGQARVIAQAQDHAGVRPEEISYVEAHGTGTPVGDPIEFAALDRAFRRGTGAQGFCGLGSVKSNIGHADTAAGVAGLIKTILALQHGELPATLHYRTVNPDIALAASPFYVVDRLRPWISTGGTRIAGVTSLGVGGTNCHVIVEEAPRLGDAEAPRMPAYLVPLSAASADALETLQASFRDFLSRSSSPDLANLAATAQRNRAHHAFRLAVRCATSEELRGGLARDDIQESAAASNSKGSGPRRWQGEAKRGTGPHIGFLFAGQGSQYVGMGRVLFEINPEFRRLMQDCERLLRSHLDRPLLDMMFSDSDDGSWIRRTEIAQPALFALEYSLAALLRTWGITPRVVIGDSIGEYVAACVAGVFTVEEGIALAAARGRLMQGAEAMQHLADLFAQVDLKQPALRFISTVSGLAVTHEVTDPRYWAAHAREPVLLAAGIETVIQEGCNILVEIGPDEMLSHLVREVRADRRVETVATLQRGEHDWEAMLETLARLHVGGARVDWTALQAGRTLRPVRLPTHPFRRTRHWYEGPSVATAATQPAAGKRHPLLGQRLRMPSSAEVRFEARFSRQAPQFLEDHRLFGVSLPPAASHLSMLAQAASNLAGNGSARVAPFRFAALHLLRPLLLPDGCQRDVQLICRPASPGWNVELTSAEARDDNHSAGDWTTHMIGQGQELAAVPCAVDTRWDLDAIRAGCQRRVSGTEFYTRIWANHGGTGSSFRWIDSIWQGDRAALCRAVCPAGVVDPSEYRLHPGLIEAACQVLHCCGDIETATQLEATGVTYIPFSVDAFVLHDVSATHRDAWCHARLHELTRENVVADLTILTSSGQVVATVEGFCLRQITRDAVVGATTAARRDERDRPGEWVPVREEAPAQLVGTVFEMTRYLQQKCAELFGQAEADIATGVSFTALGLDSLAAMQLSNHLLKDFGCTVTLRQILATDSLESLAAAICATDELSRDGGGQAGYQPIRRTNTRHD